MKGAHLIAHVPVHDPSSRRPIQSEETGFVTGKSIHQDSNL